MTGLLSNTLFPSPARCAYGLLLLALGLASPQLVRADAPSMSPATIRKVKRATVHLQVRVSNGSVYEGTGFLVDEPGLIVTNAHVVGMLEPNSRKPLKVDVTINSGEPDSKTFPGQVLGADRGTDLAVLRISAAGLPEPLKLGTAKNLNELQDVYIFGFPLGKQLGKNITIVKSSVSSLRKSSAGSITRIQVNGGMNPGNSGGPVTDAEGQVVGVAVAVIKNTSINFAIPSDHVRNFLNGRIDYVTRLTSYHAGDQIKMPVRVHLIDPLGRARKVMVELWTGPAGNARPSTGTTEPKALPDDSTKQVITLTYNAKEGMADGEVVLPKLSDPKHVYWVRPAVTNAAGDTYWVAAVGRPLGMLVNRLPVQLKYKPPAKVMFLDSSSNATLRMRDDEGGEGNIRSNFSVIMREQPTGEADGGSRQYRMNFLRVSAGIFINDKPITGKGDRGDMSRILNDMVKFLTLNVEMDGDGNQSKAEPNMARVPAGSREAVSDIADQVLQSLNVMTVSLSGDTLSPLKTWKAQRLLEIGPLGMALPAQADLKYTYLGLRDQAGKKEAVIHMEGGLRGQRSNAGNVAGSVTGTLIVAPETGQVVGATATLKVDMDAKMKGSPLKMNGELAVNLKRSATPPPPPPKKN
jgi:V8-like Glu-specific endopeptidase